MPAGLSVKLFKSHDPNIFHYMTTVCFKRVPVFRSDIACRLFTKALAETRDRCEFKLIGYVVMPDHVHLILNPLNRDIGVVMRRLKSTSARLILDWLRESNHLVSLEKLALSVPQVRSHTHSLWQKDFSSVDLWTPRFIRQKLTTSISILCEPVFANIRPIGNGRAIEPIFLTSQEACRSKSIGVAIGKKTNWQIGQNGGQRPPLNNIEND